MRERWEARQSGEANRFRTALIAHYGEEKGKAIRFAEAFEVCEYGRRPTAEELKNCFLSNKFLVTEILPAAEVIDSLRDFNHDFRLSNRRQTHTIGKFLGGLCRIPAPQLGAAAIRSARGFGGKRLRKGPNRPRDPGSGAYGGCRPGARGRATAQEQLPDETPTFTVSMVCGSGCSAVMQADQAIRSGDECRLILAGGMESMSLAPHLVLHGTRSGLKFGDQMLVDSMLHRDGLFCPKEQVGMGILADAVAFEHQVSGEARRCLCR